MIENEIGKLMVDASGGKWPARGNLGAFASLRGWGVNAEKANKRVLVGLFKTPGP